MDNGNTDNLYYAWDEVSDKDFIKMCIRFDREAKNEEVSVSSRIHRMAVPFNDPTNPSLAAFRFKKSIIDLLEEVSKEVNFNTVLFGINPKDPSKITGNSSFAKAFKHVFNAMEEGADLTKVQTTSACRQFAKEVAEKRTLERRKGELYKQVALDMVVNDMSLQGKEETPEFKREAMRRVSELLSEKASIRAAVGEKEEKEGPIEDSYSEYGKYIAGILRDIGENDPNTAYEMMVAFETRIEGVFRQWLGEKAEEKLKKRPDLKSVAAG